ncbi:MAG: extracellular solute-binding protein [Acidimicrobiia bacterium]|nr:MAG: extracellular solute-binding protein [Acidimicrobiia bacterium]
MRRPWIAIVALMLLVVSACSAMSQSRVVIAAGTTLVDSGFMARLAAAYAPNDPDAELSVIGLSSTEAIALAVAGNADVIITHNRAVLDDYLVEHPRSERADAFASTFFLVSDPSIELQAASLGDALVLVRVEGLPFVSRDDGSGTNAAELAGWASIGVDPSAETWYIRTGTGMGATLQVADQRHAVTLAEQGAYLATAQVLSLEPIPNTVIPNRYDLTLIDPSGNQAASSFAEWLVSPEGALAIEKANVDLFGVQVYAVP